MQKEDVINRFLFDETDVRGEIVTLQQCFQEAHAHQSFAPELVPLFGEFLAGTVLLSEVLKFEGSLTLQARGDGDVAIIMAEVSDRGDLRGIIRMHPEREEALFDLSDLNLKSLLGNAVLTITIDPKLGQRYQGVVPLAGATLSECLENYFQQSEQLLTRVELFANEDRCGGLFLQLLPPQLVTDTHQRTDIWQTCQHLASTLKADELFSLANEDVLLRLFHEMKCRVFAPKAIRFKCTCDRERSATALESLGFEDALALLQERDVIQIDCQFCGKTYRFGAQDLDQIFPNTGSTLH